MDDRDLDDAELWAVIDSAAAASRFRHHHQQPPLRLPSSSASPFAYRNPCRPRIKSDDGEVVQCRSNKSPRLSSDHSISADRRMIVVRHNPTPTPAMPARSPAYGSPDGKRISMNEVNPIVDSPSPEIGGKGNARHSLLIGQFPSVDTFKQYQEMALAILEKSDYTVVSGAPYIKKSGWRKMSFFFNISYEIRDKTIEYDENRNVRRAEFLVRAYMQGGRFSDGWGSCELREKRFNKPNHDIPSTAETRAKNKACQDLIGIGQVGPK